MDIRRIINSVFASNTYILTSEGKSAFLIDIGDVQPVKELLDNGGKVVEAVFLTHTHYDHIYGIRELLRLYGDCTIYTSSFGKEALGSDKLNLSRYHNDPIVLEGYHIEVLRGGDCIGLFPGECLRVLETPGHDKSCLSYFTESVVFSGDSYIPGISVVTTLPHSDKREAVRSAEAILEIAERRRLYPGHGDIG